MHKLHIIIIIIILFSNEAVMNEIRVSMNAVTKRKLPIPKGNRTPVLQSVAS